MSDGLKIFLIAILQTLVLGEFDASSLAATELFKDEAGRLIYSIDDAGVVSMFESSPGIDVTLSVTRGTREEMQPQVTEVLPASIPAGTAHVLKLKGKNLVGATVKMSRHGLEISPYTGKPTILEIPIRVAANVAPGEVRIQVETPIGRTQAIFHVTEMQIGSGNSVGSGGRRESEKRQAVPTAAPSACPAGMVGVAAESGGFCIEIDRSFSGDIRKAEKVCAVAEKRLCQANEWQNACEQTQSGSLPLKNILGEWEWTGSYGKFNIFTDELKSVLLGKADCQTQELYPSWRAGPFPGRCCK